MNAFEQHRFYRLHRCFGAVHGIARLLENDGIKNASGSDGMLYGFTKSGLRLR